MRSCEIECDWLTGYVSGLYWPIGQSSCGMSSIDLTRFLRSVHILIKQSLFYLFLSLLIKIKLVAKPSSCQWSSSKTPCNCGFTKSFAMLEIVKKGYASQCKFLLF